jgi:hypothetical protein
MTYCPDCKFFDYDCHPDPENYHYGCHRFEYWEEDEEDERG